MRNRSFLRRLVSALCGVLLLLQPGLLEGATPCVSTVAVEAERATHEHAMDEADGGATEAATDERCESTWVAGQCASAACTAPAAVIASDSPPPSAASSRGLTVAEPASLESGPDTAPELPPPRA